jgi:RNA recognition motif-containing protein
LKHFNATLRSIFAMHGIIERVDVPRDDVTHMVKGIAFVTFREKLAVESALKEPVRMLGKARPALPSVTARAM